MILVILTLLTSMDELHPIPLAFFKLSAGPNEIQLVITFDSGDLSSTLHLQPSAISGELLQEYLDSHMIWTFDGQVERPIVDAITVRKEHTEIKAYFDVDSEDISTIEIENHCLIKVASHSNIIQVDLGGDIRDFRMDEKRTTVKISM